MLFRNKNIYTPNKNLLKDYNEIREDKAKSRFCHAPFHSIVFSTYGKIQACFYNKREPLGIYPDQSIKEIWFGSKLKQLRKHIKRTDLRYGCDDCLRQINQQNYYSVGAWRYDYLATKKRKYPTSFEFQISNNCNLQCIMCNGELSNQIRKNREISEGYKTPYDDSFIEQLKEFIPHLKQASFTGGETFLIPIYYKIWDLIADLNPDINISVSTNGTVLTDRIKSYLKKLKFNFSISIDAVEEPIYSQIRKGATLKETLENFKYYLEYARSVDSLINIKVCPLRQNIYHIHEIIKYFNQYDVPVVLNNVFFPPSCTIWNLDSNKLTDILAFLKSKAEKGETKQQRDNWDRYNNLINQISNWKAEAVEREKNNKQLNSEELLKQLKSKISAYIETINYRSKTEKTEKENKYLEVISNIFNHISDESKKINTIEYFLDLPIQKVIGEIEFRDFDKLANRISQISDYEK